MQYANSTTIIKKQSMLNVRYVLFYKIIVVLFDLCVAYVVMMTCLLCLLSISFNFFNLYQINKWNSVIRTIHQS